MDAVRVALSVERPTLVALVDDRLELPWAFASIGSHAHAARESALWDPERSDFSLKHGDVSLGQDGIETHLISVVDRWRSQKMGIPLADPSPGARRSASRFVRRVDDEEAIGPLLGLRSDVRQESQEGEGPVWRVAAPLRAKASGAISTTRLRFGLASPRSPSP